jgi:hypothetical protein
MFAFSFSCSDEGPVSCGPENALIKTITFGDDFKYVFEYDDDGNVTSVVNKSVDGKITWWKETYTWDAGILEAYQREAYRRDEAGNLLDTYISESCTYGYYGEKKERIGVIKSTIKDSSEGEAHYTETTVTYNASNLPATFTSDEDEITYTWLYSEDAPFDVFAIGKEEVEGPIMSQNFTELKNYWPASYQYVRTYTRDGKFSPISQYAPLMTVYVSDAGVLQYTTKYYYKADSKGKIKSFKVDVSSCSGCNEDRELTYKCVE